MKVWEGNIVVGFLLTWGLLQSQLWQQNEAKYHFLVCLQKGRNYLFKSLKIWSYDHFSVCHNSEIYWSPFLNTISQCKLSARLFLWDHEYLKLPHQPCPSRQRSKNSLTNSLGIRTKVRNITLSSCFCLNSRLNYVKFPSYPKRYKGY